MKNNNMGFSRNDVTQLPLVSICSITYNHEPYIRQCLDGFLMQKTNFKYEIIIHDDASTDGTAEIIKEYAEKYPNLITPIFQTENQYSKGLRGFYARFIYPIAKGKYIAICEGDDYWTDPYKLQKQVDFLEANPEYGLVYGKARVYDNKLGVFTPEIIGRGVNGIDDLILSNQIPTLTVMYKKECLFGYSEFVDGQSWLMGDIAWWLYIASKSKIKFLDDILAVYRVLQNSASARNNFNAREKFINSGEDLRCFFVKKLNLSISGVELNDIRMRRLFINSLEFNKRRRAYYYYSKMKNKNWRIRVLGFICRYKICYTIMYKMKYKEL